MQVWSVLQRRFTWSYESLYYRDLTKDSISEEVVFELKISKSKLGKNNVFGRSVMSDSVFPVFWIKHSVEWRHDPSLKLLYSSSCPISIIGVLDKSNDTCDKKELPFWKLILLSSCLATPHLRKQLYKECLGVLKHSVYKARPLKGSSNWMMNVTLFVSILTATSFQKHFLHRFILGNLRSCAEQRTLWAKVPHASLWCSILKPTILWRGILYKPKTLFHHMWLKNWNY